MVRRKGGEIVLTNNGDLPNDLAGLAAYANAEHGAAMEAARAATAHARSSLEHARNSGLAVLAAKKRLGPRGGLLEWIDENLSYSHQRASEYMRLAEGWDDVPHSAHVGTISCRKAVAFLQEEPAPEEPESPPPQEDDAPGAEGTPAEAVPESDQGEGESPDAPEGAETESEPPPKPPPKREYPATDLLDSWLRRVIGMLVEMNERYGDINGMIARKGDWYKPHVPGIQMQLGAVAHDLQKIRRALRAAFPPEKKEKR